MPSRDQDRSFDDLYREARTSEGRARQQQRIRELDAQRRREAQREIDEHPRDFSISPRPPSRSTPRTRRVFDFGAAFEDNVHDAFVLRTPPILEGSFVEEADIRRREAEFLEQQRALRERLGIDIRHRASDPRCNCASCRVLSRPDAERGYAAATNSIAIWDTRALEARGLRFADLQREYERLLQENESILDSRALEARRDYYERLLREIREHESVPYYPPVTREDEFTFNGPPAAVQSACALEKGCSGYCAACKRCLQHCTCAKSESAPTRRIRL